MKLKPDKCKINWWVSVHCV